MTTDQAIVFGVLISALLLFMFGRWRYDIVALLSLLAVTLAGIVPADQAFAGFGHPAVVTVAAVLVVSRGLLNSGLVDSISRLLSRVGGNQTLQVAGLTGLVTLFSAFMNNVGALALLLPVAVRLARTNNRSPSFLLMPLAFGSLLGGMTTLIGTPPNIIIATFRAQTGAAPFRMFDFSPVGTGIAVAGLIFVSLIGWRLIPQRKGQTSREDLFQIEDYVSEVRVLDDSKFVGKPVYELEDIKEVDVTVLGLIRGDWRVPAPSRFEIIRAGDVLTVEADSESLKTLVDTARMQIGDGEEKLEPVLGSEEVGLMEAVVMANSPLAGNTAWTMGLRWRYGVNLLGVARQGSRLKGRLRGIQFQTGDILLLQGGTETLQQALQSLRCLPLAERGLRIGQPRRIVIALGLFGAALSAAAGGFLAVQIAFVAAAVGMVLAGLLSLRESYEAIDWPVIVLLGAMLPVGDTLQTTGGAELIANALLSVFGESSAVLALGALLVGTMLLSNIVNNAAAAILMAPIAVTVAQGFPASSDAFLMAITVGASAAFLTPIGHQSNTLVMGPGGYRFGDYWRMGLPVSILVVVVALPLILWVWPLTPGLR